MCSIKHVAHRRSRAAENTVAVAQSVEETHVYRGSLELAIRQTS